MSRSNVLRIAATAFFTLAAVTACTHSDQSGGAIATATATATVTAAPSASEPASPVASQSASAVAIVSEEASPTGEPSPLDTNVSIAASPVASSAPTIAGTATPVPTATPDPNLLSYSQGAYLKRWSVGMATSGAPALLDGSSLTIDPAFAGAPELVYELPSVADLSQVVFSAAGSNDPAADVRLAVSTTDDRTFADAGTVALAGSGYVKVATFPGPIRARWIRVTIDRKPGSTMYVQSIVATGTDDVPPAKLDARWAFADSAVGNSDIVFTGAKGRAAPSGTPVAGEHEAATIVDGGTFEGGSCQRASWHFWHGPVDGGRVRLGGSSVLNVVANGTLLVGSVDGEPIVARRISPASSCDIPDAGHGPAVVAIKRVPGVQNGQSDPGLVPGFRYHTVFAGTFRASDLGATHVAMLADDCTAADDLSPAQSEALLTFVTRGGVLVIRDADTCPNSDYHFAPYPFTTSAAGAHGSRGSVLEFADSSALGSTSARDGARFVDTRAYVANTSQQIGDTDVMTTSDAHWCGLMYAKNVRGQGGWVHAYARYGQGILIYNGFDSDDLQSKIPQAVTISRLEYGLNPRVTMPCGARVAIDRSGPPKRATVTPPPLPKHSIAAQLEHGGRARIYGIHFDVASARIAPASESTIREIALVLRAHPIWRMRVEGHTDSDGGAADNLALSDARAKSVAKDLTTRYGIASSRLVSVGYGLTRPVASNATSAGKALNRRVELVRL